ncbi:MAG: molybdopterin molybdotransferase MoeA [Paracoccus sp. (in: a-proteobacteria)]|uniref:molybdopterin molybdotransferase MoeA n=1 Tax=Paracoccus sp. TaxID=267 RepID=UPI0026DEAF0C|nr:gephyrin-like molybdotransferase Glp [Paracoccus sp. (in: a-proteobacteria)]MDO5620610.1 molybdopterin molybdotransferase MoeA [Paracoccus sp. (in: a-proteobacteria)]
MISVTEALTKVLALAAPPAPETVPLRDALGRVLLEPAQSRMTQPPFDAAAMDGYALRLTDAPGPLTIIGEAAAGHPWQGEARPGTAIRIFTGAPVPAGYDCVAMQENCTRDGDLLRINTPSKNMNIRPKGADFSTETTLAPGRQLTAGDLALLAAMNVPNITVARRPRVAILATGDELVPPGTPPGPGQIICSNDLAIAALAEQAGAEVNLLGIARDDADDLREKLTRGAQSDLLVTIGGASVGDHDLVGDVTAEMGLERSFYKIAMRPGKPLMAGKLADSAMLGLPGNPVSSIVCALIFMQPLIRAMQGLTTPPHLGRARLACDLRPEGPRQHYLRAALSDGPDLPQITPFDNQDSAGLSTLSQANALLIRAANDPARKAGEVMEYLPLWASV